METRHPATAIPLTAMRPPALPPQVDGKRDPDELSKFIDHWTTVALRHRATKEDAHMFAISIVRWATSPQGCPLPQEYHKYYSEAWTDMLPPPLQKESPAATTRNHADGHNSSGTGGPNAAANVAEASVETDHLRRRLEARAAPAAQRAQDTAALMAQMKQDVPSLRMQSRPVCPPSAALWEETFVSVAYGAGANKADLPGDFVTVKAEARALRDAWVQEQGERIVISHQVDSSDITFSGIHSNDHLYYTATGKITVYYVPRKVAVASVENDDLRLRLEAAEARATPAEQRAQDTAALMAQMQQDVQSLRRRRRASASPSSAAGNTAN